MKRPMNGTAIFDRIIDIFAFLCGVIIIFMMLSVSVDVFMRAAFNNPITGMLEINEYALLYTTFLGTAWVLRRGRHVTVDMAVNQLKPKMRALAETVTSMMGVFACAILTWYSAQSTWDHFIRGYKNPGAVLEIPTAAVLVIIPLCSFLLIVQFIRRTTTYWGKWQDLSHKG